MVKLVLDPFLKSQNWAYLHTNSLKFYTASFYCMSSWGLLQYIETKLHATCIYFIWSFLEKRGLQLVCLSHFLNDFLKTIYYLVVFYCLTKFHCLVAFTSWDIGQYVNCDCLLTRMWRQKFWNYSYLFNQAIFSTWTKSHDKKLDILRTESAFKMKKKTIFHHSYKAFIEANKTIFLDGESPTVKMSHFPYFGHKKSLL